MSRRRSLWMLTDSLSTVGSKLLRRDFANDLLSRLASTFHLLSNHLLRDSYPFGGITSGSGLLTPDRIEIGRLFLP